MKDAIFKLVRDHYKTMQGYSSAGMEAGKDESKIYLNANENPHELPGLEGLNRYPEPQPLHLREAFAQNYGVENDQLLITRGADEAIVLLTKVFCEPHKDQILINPPTFGMYKVNAHGMPAMGVVEVPLIPENGTFILNKEAIIRCATDPDQNVKLIFLCSPNNPTGDSFSHEVISEICEAVEGHAIIILDETYAEFAEQGSMTDDLDSTPNLVILRTLSKSYSFAGMRMGCILCGDTDFIDLVRIKTMDAYPLPRMSIEAAFHVLSPEIKEIAQKNIKKLLEEREVVKTALEASDHVRYVYTSDANFLLVEMADAKGFCDYAASQNIILRDFSDKIGTENCLRISIGTPEQNKLILELLKSF